jgi:TRAP-type C4-dicarboxylate transport system substrate-binding protein
MTTTITRRGSIAGSMLALAVAAGLGAQPAKAAEFTMKMGTLSFNDAEHGYTIALKEKLEKATNGRIEVQLFPRGQLGSPAATVQGLQLGTIEAYIMPIDFFAGVDPRAGVFSIPFMFKNRAHSNQAFQDKELFDAVMTLFESKGIVGVMLAGQADGRYIAKNPLRKLSDFSGKKMRVNATDAERERMKRLGATAIPMGLQEMITALHNGTIDGTMSGQTIHTNFKLYNYSKTLLKTEDTLLVSFGAISKKWLDTLPADLRATVINTARGMQKEYVALTDQKIKEQEAEWIKHGGEFITWSPQEMDEMRKSLGTVGEVVTAKTPELKAFYQKVKAISNKY